MRCISPIRLNSGQFVPCSKCNFCLAQRRADWSFRLRQELKTANTAVFITLTYSDFHMPYTLDGLGELCKYDLQCFFKRVRKAQAICLLPSDYPSIRYYAVGEYGSRTFRPHYHAIVFNLHSSIMFKLDTLWGLGSVHLGVCNGATIHYTTKYVINKDMEVGSRAKPFTAISNRSGGIGKSYLDVIGRSDSRPTFVRCDGVPMRMPRYYKDKLFTQSEKLLMQVGATRQYEIKQLEELVRLSAYHPDPYGYYLEVRKQAYDRISSKSKSSDKL